MVEKTAVTTGWSSISLLVSVPAKVAMPFPSPTFYRLEDGKPSGFWMHTAHIVDMQAVQIVTHTIPRYFFRVLSEISAGVNTNDWFRSEAVRQGLGAAMEDTSEADIRENLRDHMHEKKDGFASQWISFTKSLLVALNRAVRLKQKGHKNIRLAIVDTFKLDSESKIFSARALLKAYDINLFLRNLEGAEILVWGELIAPATLIPLEEYLRGERVENGLFEEGFRQLQPQHFKPLGEDTDTIRKQRSGALNANLRAPCHIRPTNYSTTRDSQQKNRRVPMAANIMRKQVDVVKKHFPLEFQFPVLIALLSSLLYKFERDSVVEQLEVIKDDPMIFNYDCWIRPFKSPDLPELDFHDILLKEAGESLGLKVFSLDVLLKTGKARRFSVPSTPQTILPSFNQTNVDAAIYYGDKAITAMKKRKAEEDAQARSAADAQAKRLRKAVRPTEMKLQDILDSIK
ncbi:hypothetical protein EDD36DRAFT_418043 [Exophiala viscosa]|uniref:DUF7587 domain-containing protein n=1 Tax=Exophiala viscosa TaxID=2486360 RepID=A0AAN6IDS5_9EURO|nr:hypothetical protein EDD36DRAFT_418043 [Exophiala viscosa]